MNSKSPEDWEAEDHITNMKGILRGPQLDECPTPDTPKALLQVLIWVVRRLDLSAKNKEKQNSGTHASFLRGLFVFDGFSAGDVMKLMLVGIGIWVLIHATSFKDDVKKELRLEIQRVMNIEQAVEKRFETAKLGDAK